MRFISNIDPYLRFGLGGKPPLSVKQVAKTLKLGRERVRRIETKALNKFEKILPQNDL